MELNDTLPLVVIKCLVYNHEPYLRECLNGFVMQQTNFPFVAIVHDDASTDKSADIIREYAVKYPNIIKPIYETENQYSKGDGSLGRIMDATIETIGAKYIAMCEGDDYWTDPHKLQKQVDYLEAHPNCALCFHQVKIYNQATTKFVSDDVVYQRGIGGQSTIKELCLLGNYIHTPSVVYRYNWEVVKKMECIGSVIPGDYPLWILTAEYGYIYKFEDIMGVYRIGSGIWSTQTNCITIYLQMYSMLNRLRVVIDSMEIRQVIDKQCNMYSNLISGAYNSVTKENESVHHSYAYQIGKVIVRPFAIIKRILLS